MLGPFIDGVDTVLDAITSALKSSIHDYCDIETVDDPHTLVAKNGALLSVVQIHGIRNLVSTKTLYETVVAPLTTATQSAFSGNGHQIQVWFEVDPDRTAEELSRVMAPSRETSRRLNMDMKDILDEREENMLRYTAHERCYLVLWTLPAALTKSERQTEKKLHGKDVKDKHLTAHGQDPLRANSLLRNRHVSFVDMFCTEMASVAIVTERLTARDALREIRRTIDPDFTDNAWQAALPGDRPYPTIRKNKSAVEEWETLWPPISWQLCPRDGTIVSENVIEIGDRAYAPLYVDLFPSQPHTFAHLFARALSKKLPWRMSFLMEGGGLDGFRFRGLIAQIIGFASSGNKMMSNALKELKELQSQSVAIVQGRIALTTWAPKTDPDLLSRRMSDLARCVEAWGSCQVSEVTGDPMAGVASAALAFTQGSIGTKVAAPLDDLLIMMPLGRPSSPWRTGEVTWCSPDGKLMPYQPYSSLQSSWINLIFARPGSGKSVLMNMMNLALCLSPKNATTLPRVAIIDVGPSSSGLISLLRDALPPNLRHMVAHKRLRMTEQHAINAFDTQLGCRFPTSVELMFLHNFVTLLVTDMDSDRPEKGVPGLVAEVVREMYVRRSDREDPNRYSRGIVPKVDDALDRINAAIDNRTTWWEVVDFLFDAGEHYMARVAQRYAVPLLADAVGAAQSERIRATYGQMRIQSTGELLIDAFSRSITEALSFYPILARPTAFDVGDANVVAIDLGDVARGGGVVGDRVSAVMYMLARQVLAKDYYLNEESVAEMPAPDALELRESVPRLKYKNYHRERIRDLSSTPKRICYDEFHRTANAPAVRAQVTTDMREGRKFQVDIILASQALEDFDENMIKFATGLFIMDGGSELTVKEISEKFGFEDDAERVALRQSVRAPSQGRPGIFMAKFITNQENYTMLLSAPLGPIELWAFSTTAEDVAIRQRLYETMGPARARRALAKVYPRGSAKADLEDQAEALREQVGVLDEKASNNLIAKIADQVRQSAEEMGI